MGDINMSSRSMLLHIATVLSLVTVEAIKFKRGQHFFPPGVTDLITEEATDLNCDYIKWKNERLYSITWSIRYMGLRSGQRTDFFVWHQDGKKESIVLPILEVEEDNS